MYQEQLGVKINVRPVEGERFASPQVVGDEQREEWCVSASFRSGQKRAHLIGRYGGSLVGGYLRPPYSMGRVMRYRLVAHGHIEHGAQDRVRRADRGLSQPAVSRSVKAGIESRQKKWLNGALVGQ
jgi:hypothetical protein